MSGADGRSGQREGVALKSRRQVLGFSLIMPTCLALPGIVLPAENAGAQWQGFVIRVIARGIFRLLGRATVTGTARAGAARSVPRFVSALGAVVASEVAARAAEAAVDSIWITDGGHKNEADIYIGNPSDEYVNTTLYLGVKDADTGRVDVGWEQTTLTARPKSQASLTYIFRDLPYTGLKNIDVRAETNRLQYAASDRFLAVTAAEASGG